MDRYEFNLKSQQMRKLAADGRYDEAALIADEIDWSRVKNTRLLMLTADIYEATEQPEKEYDILDIAYERSPMGKQLAYRLALLASELKDYEEAENYYKDYVDMAPRDSRRYLLRYRLSKARGEDLDLLIGLLERYLDDDMEERWTYELCELYAKAGYQQKCIDLCDELITWFGDGKYVLAALKLKKKYASLSVSQQQKYEALKREAGEEPEDEEEVGVEIARTRNEIMRNRTLPEKMQAVAEKRMQEDAGSSDKRDKPEKDADGNAKAKKAKSQPSKKAKSGAKAKERERKPAPAAEETAEKSAVTERVTSPSESALKSDGKDLSAGIAAGKDVSVGTAAGKNILAGTDPEKDISVGAAAGKYISTRTAPERELSEGITAGKNIPDGTSAGKADGATRRYDGSAVRRAEAATERRQADESAEAAWRRTDENAAGRVTAGKKSPEEEGVAGKAQTGTQASYGNSAANRKSVEGAVVFDVRDTANIRENAKAENIWEAPEVGPGVDADEIHIKTYSDRPYDTMNIQAELAKSMEAILRADEAKAAQKAAKRTGRQGSGPAVRTYVPPASGAAEEDPFGYEQERKEPEKQITGQMSIEEILKDLQTRGILKEDTVENALRVTGQMPLWKVKEAEAAEDTSEHDTDAEGETAEEKSEAEKNEAEEGVTEESVVKEMEEISLRDFTTGEIDLEIVQNEVDEQHKATSEKQEDENVPEAMEEADLPEEVKETTLAEESESANFPEETEESELTGDRGEAKLPKEAGETDPEEESEHANLPEEENETALSED
ncbi:MAG: hypothetical protein LUE29_11750, partial [Lachnospiraceae bacterium]|nr:hypothetical protein [Lachnospiraceae bacterium]